MNIERRRRRNCGQRDPAICCCFLVAASALVLLSHVSSVAAFSSHPSVSSTLLSSSSYFHVAMPSVALFGVRSNLKRSLKSRFGKKGESPKTDNIDESTSHTENHTVDESFPSIDATAAAPSSSGSRGVMEESSANQLEPKMEPGTSSVALAMEQRPSLQVLEEGPVELPPIEEGRTLTKLEDEFREIMGDAAALPSKDIAAVPGPRLRDILEGARAGAGEREVYRAFEVLFQDLVPLRIAGRMIFSKLMQEVRVANQRHVEQVEALATSTGLCPQEIEQGRFTFLQIAQHEDDGGSFLTIEQLVETGVATTIVELLGYENFDELLTDLDKDQTGRLTFEQLIIGLQRCDGVDETCVLECQPSTVLQELAKRMEPTKVTSNTDQRRRKYEEKYESMVQTFVEWEDRVPKGEGRRLDILRGCFVGARNAKVVSALEIVYCDYSALRMAGDLIFGLMCKVMRTGQ